MYNELIPFIKENETMNLFNLLEDQSYAILSEYLKTNNWHNEAKRLEESRYTGVGTYRLLLAMFLEYQKGSFENLILFYDRCKRPKDEPHYEDLITATLIAIIIGIITNALYDIIKGLRSNKEFSKQIWNKISNIVNYLFRARWARDMFWKKEIQKDNYIVINKILIKIYITNDKLEDVENKTFLEIEDYFQKTAKNHNLNLSDMETSFLIPLIELAQRDNTELTTILDDYKKLLKDERKD